MRKLMDEERAGIEKLVIVKTSPFISAGPGMITFGGQWIRGRRETQDVKN
jgi:hypothetical protein